MPSQEQISTELKHISLLRKTLIGKQALTLDFKGVDWSGKLSLADGMIESNDETLACLTYIFSQPIFSFSWQPLASPLASPLEPKFAFYRSLWGMEIDDHRQTIYQEAFSKLPPVHVKAGTLFRLNIEDMNQYKKLYHLGLDEKGVRISEYLDVADSSRALYLRRLRIVLTCYCLGQLIPVNNQNRKMSMAAKILARLRRSS